MKLEAFPEVNVVVNPRLLKRYPLLQRMDLVESFLTRPWILPTLESNHYLTGMGITRNEASPTAVNLDDNGKVLEVFSKPIEAEMGRREFRNSIVAHRRKISTPLLLVLIEFNDASLLLGKLFHSVEPLSARSLDYSFINTRVYRPCELLTDFLRFIADFHGKGLVHGDLHLGNIGFKFRENRPPAKILFDLESSYTLDDCDLFMKNEGHNIPKELQNKIEIFEIMAIDDLGTFLAYLSDRNFPIERDELLQMAGNVYNKSRPFSYGMTRGKSFHTALNNRYDKVLRSLKKIDKIS